MSLRRSLWLFPPALLALAIPACGGGGDDTTTAPAGASTGGSAGASAGGSSNHATGGTSAAGHAGTSAAAGSSGSAGHAAGGAAGHTTGGASGASGASGHAAGGASGKGGSAGVSAAGGASAGGASAGGASAGGAISTGGASTGGNVGIGGSSGAGGSPLVCATGTANCDGNDANGCEVDLDTDPANCGQCKMPCDTGAMCVKGACACAGTTQKATLIPLDMYIMLDHSGSMKDNMKWTSVSAALDQFFMDTSAADLGVGLAFFPIGTKDTKCAASDYSTPIVDIAPLGSTGQAAKLTSAVMTEMPNGNGTPTVPALQGAIDKAVAWKTANPTHTVVVVLATDGQPNGCGGIAQVETVAASGVSGTTPVLTYVIGVGSSTGNLDGIAMSGGTTSAFPVDNGDSAAFLAALKKIQGTSIGCQYLVPAPTMGQTLDFTKVNVEYTPGGGGPTVTLPYVTNVAGCAANPTGWYYDVPAAPTQILLCSNECTTVKADMSAAINVVLGCTSQKP